MAGAVELSIDDGQRYQLASIERCKLEGGEVILAREACAETRLPLVALQVLLHFAEPRTITEVFPSVDGIELPAFADLVRLLTSMGFLTAQRSDAAEREEIAKLGLFAYLRDSLTTEPARRAIRQHLRAGRCVAIRDALRADFADEVQADLSGYSGWKVSEDFSQPAFGFRFHTLHERHLFPAAVRRCERLFASGATRRDVGELSGRDCSGEPSFSACLYTPGDYALPHTDHSGTRNVAFVWNVSKDWRPEWGGAFYWCPSMSNVAPSFNTLILFNVHAKSTHLVTPVAPTARGQRLTVTGWWLAATEQGVDRQVDSAHADIDTPHDLEGVQVL